jgi:hypothetical protein
MFSAVARRVVAFALLTSAGTVSAEESECLSVPALTMADLTVAERWAMRRRPVDADGPRNALTQGIERVVEKKFFELWGDPWTMQGLPIVFPSPSTGLNLGLKLMVQNIRRQDPHKYELDAQVLVSDRGRMKHALRVDVPHAISDRVRFTGRIAYDRDLTLPYFGIGNEVYLNPADLERDLPLFENTRSSPSITLDSLIYASKRVRLGPIAGFRWTDVSYPNPSLLAQQQPLGVDGGKTHYVGFGIMYDSLDWEPYPSQGAYHELFVRWHDRFIGSDFTFRRYTYTFRWYHRLHRRLVFGQRWIAEWLDGNVPFFEMAALGGSWPSIAWGADRFMRGYEANLFVDKARIAASFELRWDPIYFTFYGQDITLGFVPFVDTGRVAPSFDKFSTKGWKGSLGMGVRVIAQTRLVVRADFAVTQDAAAFYVNLGNSF